MGIGTRGHSGSGFGWRDALVALGLACLLATMLVYSAAAMPFQRFETLPDFVGVLSDSLRVAAVAGALAALLSCLEKGRALLASLPVRLAFAIVYLMGTGAFCAMALGGAWDTSTFWPVGSCIGVGCVGQALAWGRALSRYNLREATGVVAASAVVAALAGWAQLHMGEVAAVALFTTCALCCVALPFVPAIGTTQAGAGASGEAGTEDPRPDSAPQPRASRLARVGAFVRMALVPGIGLALFAMMMAVRGELFFDDYLSYVVIQVVVAAILLACMLLPARVPLLRAVYRGLIPFLSVAVLAFNYLSEVLLGGSTAEATLVIVLYTAAALLTLSTLAGISHAAEFSSDLVVSVAMTLFALVTVVTQEVCSGMAVAQEGVRVLIATTSGAYATGMIVYALWRGLRADRDDALGLVGLDIAGTGPRGESGTLVAGAPGIADGTDALVFAAGIDDRCDDLARRFGLTAREREVLGYLARGHNGVYISDELLISPNTARSHIHNIYGKLNVTTREDILRLTRG